MKIYIELADGAKKEQLVHLQNYLNKQKLDGIEDIAIEKSTAKKGEMGGGIFGTISAVLVGTQGPLTKLAECLGIYIQTFKSEIKLRNDQGQELYINSKHFDNESINLLVDKFFGKETKKPATRKKTVKAK